MAKKIRLDFSKTEERSGWNTKQMPEGLHKMKVVGVEETEAQDGTAMLVYALTPSDPRFKTRRFPFYCKLQQNQLWKLRDLLVAAGVSVPKKAISIDPAAPVGKEIAVEVADATGQYEGRSEINGTYGLDILDEEAPADDEDDEGEEDEDNYAEDDADEAEDEEEAEEDDLSSLSLPELRKRAKALGLSIAKKSADDLIDEITDAEADAAEDVEDEDELDEEDLEDEDLGDEELEDDEEEEPAPAPAPRKRPAAAKAAPAKRVVKRR